MALSSATPASCISNLQKTPTTGVGSLSINQLLLRWQSGTCQLGPDLPVRGGDGVVDGQLQGTEILQATISHVWE